MNEVTTCQNNSADDACLNIAWGIGGEGLGWLLPKNFVPFSKERREHPISKIAQHFCPWSNLEKHFLEWLATATYNFAIKDNTLASLCVKMNSNHAQQNKSVTSIIRPSVTVTFP